MSLLTPDIGLLFWMTLSFGMVFFVLAKFAFPIITKAVDERAERIETSLEEARLAQEKVDDLNAEALGILHNARDERREILDEAREIKKKMLTEAKQLAETEAKQRLKHAAAEVEEMKLRALRQLQQQVADLSVHVAEKVIAAQLTRDDEQQALIERMLDEETTRKR